PFDKQPNFRYASELFRYWINVLGSLGINVSRYSLEEEDKIRAFSIFKERKAVIVINTDDADNGKTFSLFHELCHVLLRNTGICDLHDDESIETYCNNFASEMLIPQKKL